MSESKCFPTYGCQPCNLLLASTCCSICGEGVDWESSIPVLYVSPPFPLSGRLCLDAGPGSTPGPHNHITHNDMCKPDGNPDLSAGHVLLPPFPTSFYNLCASLPGALAVIMWPSICCSPSDLVDGCVL